MEVEKDLYIIVLNIPEHSDLCRNSFDRLSKIIHALTLQQTETLPYIEDLESMEIGTEDSGMIEADVASSSSGVRKVSIHSALPRIKAVLMNKTELGKNLAKLEKERKPIGFVVPKGDVDNKLLDKNLGKIQSFKDKNFIQIIFLGPKISPLLDRNQPQNSKVSQKFWSFAKFQAPDEEQCLKEFMKHLSQFQI